IAPVAVHASFRNVAVAAQVLVAGGASHLRQRMRVPQRKARARVVEAGGLPVLCRMAVGAAIAQVGVVLVVLAVAADACARGLFVDQAAMAVLARSLPMAAEQGEAGPVMLEAHGVLPAALAVAADTVLTQRSLVLVILLVTVGAAGASLVAIEDAGMAAGAAHVPVLCQQRVACVDVVAERDLRPAQGVVTAFALLAELVLVLVFLAVAAQAGLGRFLVVPGLVTGLAARLGVCAGEGKSRRTMVEPRLAPAPLVVAVLAGAALVRCGAVLLPREVALGTVGLAVLRAQRVVGLLVVEAALVELGDAHVTAPVVGVAGPAGLPLHAPVEARALRQVAPDVLVAIGTQPVLGLPVEADVAMLAVVLPLRVTGDQRPR